MPIGASGADICSDDGQSLLLAISAFPGGLLSIIGADPWAGDPHFNEFTGAPTGCEVQIGWPGGANGPADGCGANELAGTDGEW